MTKNKVSKLTMVAGALGLALGIVQSVQAANPDSWIVYPTVTQSRRADTPSGRFVNYTLTVNTTYARVQPVTSNQLYGVPTPFHAEVMVGCQIQHPNYYGTRSWTFNASQYYPALTKSCSGYGALWAAQGGLMIDI